MASGTGSGNTNQGSWSTTNEAVDGDGGELLLFCDTEECEKSRQRLLSFDAKKYELVVADDEEEDATTTGDDTAIVGGGISSEKNRHFTAPKSSSASDELTVWRLQNGGTHSLLLT